MSDNLQKPDIADAVKLLQAEDVEQADKLLRNILAQDRHNVDALYLLGIVGCKNQHWVEAAELIGRALSIDPERVRYHESLGEVQLALGQFDEAVSSFQILLSAEPDNALVCFNLGRAHALRGQRSDAIPQFERAVAVRPDFLEARRALASLFLEGGQAAAAISQYEEIMQQAPDDIEAIANCGAALTSAGRADDAIKLLIKAREQQSQNSLVLGNLGHAFAAADRYDEAVIPLQEALTVEPRNPRLLNNIANILRRLRRFEEAERHLLDALEVRADYAEARNNLALVYFDQNRFEEAEAEITRALALAPNASRAVNNLGLIQQYTNRMAEAAASFQKALELDPSYLEAQTNLATVYSGIGRLDEALEIFDLVLARNPTSLVARWNRSNAFLLGGDYGRGWDAYELRWEIDDEVHRVFAQPHWGVEDLNGRSITVYGEQGPGDVVMFAHCIGDLYGQTEQVSLQVDDRLVALMGRSFPGCSVVSERAVHGGWASTETDLVVPFGSLPRRFRRNESDFEQVQGRYLTTDVGAVDDWVRRFAALGDGPTIGISWRGGVNALERSRRFMNLADWSELIGDPRLTIVNLQHGDCAEELATFKSEHDITVHSWDDTGMDLDDFAAQIDALDLVLSVANTTVHFAGALGKQVWVVAPAQPSWRWQIDRVDSPWYRSARLFRQGQDQTWRHVLDGMSDELCRWIDEQGDS
jgi:tetratricopeptide (TPR) repeat protein